MTSLPHSDSYFMYRKMFLFRTVLLFVPAVKGNCCRYEANCSCCSASHSLLQNLLSQISRLLSSLTKRAQREWGMQNNWEERLSTREEDNVNTFGIQWHIIVRDTDSMAGHEDSTWRQDNRYTRLFLYAILLSFFRQRTTYSYSIFCIPFRWSSSFVCSLVCSRVCSNRRRQDNLCHSTSMRRTCMPQ